MLEKEDLEKIQQLIAAALKPIKPTKKKAKTKVKTIAKKKTTPVIVPQEAIQTTPRIRKIGTVVKQAENIHSTKGRQCRTEPMNIVQNRPNNFLNSADAKLFKNDSVIDKKLSGNLIPTPRRQMVEMWEIACKICGRQCIVSPSMIMEDPETHEVSYTCDSCIRR